MTDIIITIIVNNISILTEVVVVDSEINVWNMVLVLQVMMRPVTPRQTGRSMMDIVTTSAVWNQSCPCPGTQPETSVTRMAVIWPAFCQQKKIPLLKLW